MVRWKKRYFVLKVTFFDSFKRFATSDEIKRAIMKNVEKLYGEYGSAVVFKGFEVKYYNEKTRILYLRVNRCVSQMVTASLPLVSSIAREPASISCLFCAATIRHANIFMMKHHEKALQEINQSNSKKSGQIDLKTKILNRRKKRV